MLGPGQQGDIYCELCRSPFHSMCVGVQPGMPYTCEPCKQKHNSARSSCLCHSCDDDIKQNWISCDVCQTWYHQKCVGIDQSAEQQEFICPKCSQTDIEILTRPLQSADYKLLVASFSKLRQSKYAWPFNQANQPVSMNRIIQKISLNSYVTFKEFMDEMIDMFQRFRDHFDQNGSHSSKEYKCCEIVEYDFSNAVREFITKGQKQRW